MSQRETLLSMLRKGSITHLDANKVGILCFTARLTEIRQLGHLVICEMETNGGKRYGRYTLVSEATLAALERNDT